MTEVPVTISGNGNRAASPERAHLSFREALQPPCLDCQSSPCCTHLLLSDFPVQALMDVDYALFLLNFEGIVLGLRQDWKMDVYLNQPCGYLDVPSGLCTVHSTPVQPAVCVHYNGHTCGYRYRMEVEQHGVDTIRPLVDHDRMSWLADRLEFDEERRIVARPEWDEVVAGFDTIRMDRRAIGQPPADPVYEEWRSIALTQKPPAEARRMVHHDDPSVSSPCDGCGAWCCDVLVFNRGLPGDASQLEFLRYCLGFPAVEIGIAEDGWAVIVHTRCRHLEGGRCSVYGTDARPLRCNYYDALSCGYRGHFGVPQPADIVRVKRDHFAAVTSALVFDDLGRIVAVPPLDLMRRQVEDSMRAEAGLAPVGRLVAVSGEEGPECQ
ncbi:MAG TPA: hypothetical protein VKI19_05325 [Acidimicrobiales bacterium]|nr:hypothetical protein [Acidimicrobiales bacterium]